MSCLNIWRVKIQIQKRHKNYKNYFTTEQRALQMHVILECQKMSMRKTKGEEFLKYEKREKYLLLKNKLELFSWESFRVRKNSQSQASANNSTLTDHKIHSVILQHQNDLRLLDNRPDIFNREDTLEYKPFLFTFERLIEQRCKEETISTITYFSTRMEKLSSYQQSVTILMLD